LGRDLREQRNYSEKVAEEIDAEIDLFIARAVNTATDLIKQNKVKIDSLVAVLLEKETIEKDDFEKLMKK